MDSEDKYVTQTLGGILTGSPSVRVQLESLQASVVSKIEKCDDQAKSPMKTKLHRCTTSKLSDPSTDQPAHPKEHLCHSGGGDNLYQPTAGSYISVNGNGGIQVIPCQHTYQTITVTNTGNLCPGTPMMQYVVHSRDGTQTYVMPDDKIMLEATTGDMSAYQICSPTSGLSHETCSSPGSLPSPQQLSEEATRKRELRLLKNRVAAKECRRRKKEYEQHLETRLMMLENQNKRLRRELEYFKNVHTGMTKSC